MLFESFNNTSIQERRKERLRKLWWISIIAIKGRLYDWVLRNNLEESIERKIGEEEAGLITIMCRPYLHHKTDDTKEENQAFRKAYGTVVGKNSLKQWQI